MNNTNPDTITITRWRCGSSPKLIVAGPLEKTRKTAQAHFGQNSDLFGKEDQMSRAEFEQLEEFEG